MSNHLAITVVLLALSASAQDSEVKGARGSFKGKFGHLEGRWTDVRINTVTGDVSVLHAVRA